MKYQWVKKPPKGVPGVASEKAGVWPKPDAATLKYTKVNSLLVAIGKIKISGRWEVYVFETFAEPTKAGSHKVVTRWRAKSRKKGPARFGYTDYPTAYRSIPQHLRNL